MKRTNYIKIQDGRVDSQLDVMFYEEDGITYAYAPALDLVGYGNNLDEAKASFEIVIEEYFKFTTENNTLEADLRSHGWAVKEEESYNSPRFVDILKKNKQLQNVVNNDYSKVSEQFSYSFS